MLSGVGCGAELVRIATRRAHTIAQTRHNTAHICGCRYDYDLPILALDLVVAGGAVTLAVADACPLSPNLMLPRHYMQTVVELQVRVPMCRAHLQRKRLRHRLADFHRAHRMQRGTIQQHTLPRECTYAPPSNVHVPLPRFSQEAFLDEPATSRAVPEWGKAIFSPLAVCMRPSSEEGLAGFIKYCVALTRAHLMVRGSGREGGRGTLLAHSCARTEWAHSAVSNTHSSTNSTNSCRTQYASLLSPVNPRTKSGARRLAELTAGHQRFVTNQLANKKTSRVLEVAFGTALTDAYMEGLMFDFDPSDSPPWFDGSLSRLYRHFDRRPEPWADGEKLLAIRQKLDADKARVFLERCACYGTCAGGERCHAPCSGVPS